MRAFRVLERLPFDESQSRSMYQRKEERGKRVPKPCTTSVQTAVSAAQIPPTYTTALTRRYSRMLTQRWCSSSSRSPRGRISPQTARVHCSWPRWCASQGKTTPDLKPGKRSSSDKSDQTIQRTTSRKDRHTPLLDCSSGDSGQEREDRRDHKRSLMRHIACEAKHRPQAD
jgi:hypothetical protein